MLLNRVTKLGPSMTGKLSGRSVMPTSVSAETVHEPRPLCRSSHKAGYVQLKLLVVAFESRFKVRSWQVEAQTASSRKLIWVALPVQPDYSLS